MSPARRAVVRRAALALLVALVVAGGALAALTVGSRPLTDPAPVGTPTAAPSPAPTPTGTTAPVLDGAHVVLDPGHNAGNAAAPEQINAPVDDGRGGTKACNTVGTSTASGYPEHAFTWDVADRVRQALLAAGAEVTLTRTAEGVGPCVSERGAAAAAGDLLVSIHANGSEDPAVRGFFAMVPDPPLNDAQGEPSRRLARALTDALTAAGLPPSSLYPDPVIGRADLATLNHAERPVVMLELAEMRNPEEAAAVQSAAGRQRYADAVAAGVTAWLTARE